MVSLAIQQHLPPRLDERHTWTAQDSREIALFGARCMAIAGLAVLLYAAGPYVGLALVAGGLAVWSRLRQSDLEKGDKSN